MKSISKWVALVGFCCLSAVLVTIVIDSNVRGQRRRSSSGDRLGSRTIAVDQFAPQSVLRPQAPIVDPPFVAAAKAQDQIEPNELVLGLVINNQARAYPINMLTGPSREIFNDELGGQAIAATW